MEGPLVIESLSFPRASRRALVLGTVTLLMALSALGAKVETWRQDASATFSKGKKERVVVSDSGRVRLGRKVEAVGSLEAVHVWDLARAADGSLYAATGSSGKVFRKEKGKADWSVVHDSDDSQALSVAITADGRVFVGTGPSGSVVEVSDPKAKPERPDPAVKYIWDLAADADGGLLAATGPTGQLWKRSKEGKWSVLLDSKHPHLLCVAVGPDGSIFAGSDGEGLIYKVAPGGKVSVLYDAPQAEIHTLKIGPDGALFAGTAVEAGGGGGAPGGGPPRGFASAVENEPRGADRVVRLASFQEPPKGRPEPPAPGDRPSGGTSPRPGPPGENSVYRIGPDGAPREVFKAKALIYAIAFADDRLDVGTGPRGRFTRSATSAGNPRRSPGSTTARPFACSPARAGKS